MPKLTVLVGPPGVGKSTFAENYYINLSVGNGFVYINQDTQSKKHLEYFHKAINDNSETILIDRMNFSKQQRARYLNPAKEKGYETEIIVLHQPRAVCFKRAVARQDHPTIKTEQDANNALNTFFGKYERPTPDEADKITFVYPEGAKEQAIIVDLDGTLCNVDHRLHFVRKPQGEKKDWKSFFQNLDKDPVNPWCASIINEMSQMYPILFASGRPDNYRKQTEEWLESNSFSTSHLYMRCRNDSRQDYIAKEIILDFEILTRFQPLFFVDDRDQVVQLWRRRGFTCLQCANGEF